MLNRTRKPILPILLGITLCGVAVGGYSGSSATDEGDVEAKFQENQKTGKFPNPKSVPTLQPTSAPTQ